jgi:hypothetical protein
MKLKYIILIAVFLLIIGIVAANWQKITGKKNEGDQPAGTTTPDASGNTTPAPAKSESIIQKVISYIAPANLNKDKSLLEGSSGAEVKELQHMMNQHGSNLTADGSFGPATHAEVKRVFGFDAITLNQATAFYTNASTPTLTFQNIFGF